jgi:hypothetical protein
MRDEKTRIAVIILVLAFLATLFVFRKLIRYPFCSLENYSGRFVGRGKSSYYFIAHLILSLGLGLVCFYLLTINENLNDFFDNTILRLGTIFLIWMFWSLGLGLLIELYLENTDNEYKRWKIKQKNKG